MRKEEEVRRELRRWRRSKDGVNSYTEKGGEYRKLCEAKKAKERERLTREIAAAAAESKVWEITNRGRTGRKRVNESIEKEEWQEYFIGWLGEVGEVIRVEQGKARRRKRRER